MFLVAMPEAPSGILLCKAIWTEENKNSRLAEDFLCVTYVCSLILQAALAGTSASGAGAKSSCLWMFHTSSKQG